MKKRLVSVLLGSTLVAGALARAGAPPPPSPPKKTPELVEKGKAAFNVYCVPCHGPTGDGDGPAAITLSPRPRRFKDEPFKLGDRPEEVWRTITVGSPGTAMVGWPSIPDEDRWGLTYYVLSLRPAPKGKVKKK